MQMPGRHGSLSGANYRYKFNGMEADGEVSGESNSYTTQFRQYDPRLGRWKSLDPLAGKFPNQSPFCGMDNNPISLIDPLGLATENGGEPAGGKGTTGTDEGESERSAPEVDNMKQGLSILDDKSRSGDVDNHYFKYGGNMYKAGYNMQSNSWSISVKTGNGYQNTGITHNAPEKNNGVTQSDDKKPAGQGTTKSTPMSATSNNSPDLTATKSSSPIQQDMETIGSIPVKKVTRKTLDESLYFTGAATTGSLAYLDYSYFGRNAVHNFKYVPQEVSLALLPGKNGLINIPGKAYYGAKTVLNTVGHGVTIVGMVLTLDDMMKGKIDPMEGVVDMAIAGWGMTPQGAPFALVYFTIKFIFRDVEPSGNMPNPDQPGEGIDRMNPVNFEPIFRHWKFDQPQIVIPQRRAYFERN